MPEVRWYRRPLPAALLFGGGYAVAAFVLQIGSPVGILVASVLLAGFGWLIASRQLRKRPPLPLAGTVALGVGALGLYTAALILSEPPTGTEWIAVVFVFAIPIALLVMAYREWRTRP